MKTRLVAAALTLTLWLGAAVAQDPQCLYTQPEVPSPEALDRLHLKRCWSVYLPMDGRRDGISSIQIAPLGSGSSQLLVQTRSGLLAVADGANGQILWSVRVGEAYRPALPVAFNKQAIFVVNNVELYALDRATGTPQWQLRLPNGAAAPPTADEDQLYLSLSGRGLVVYRLGTRDPAPADPTSGLAKLEKDSLDLAREQLARMRQVGLSATQPVSSLRVFGRPEGAAAANLLLPRELFSFRSRTRFEQAPVASRDRVLLPESGGTIVGLPREEPRLSYSIPTGGDLTVPVAQHDDMAYVASASQSLYAVNIVTGRVVWRAPLGGMVFHRPAALDDDAYLSATGSGLTRFHRANGDALWRAEGVERFLAANPKFVYAYDAQRRLLVIDRVRGTVLSAYGGTRDFAVPYGNDLTDRVYLAANNGLLVCLHDRDYANELRMKKVEEPAPVEKPGAKKPTTKPGAAKPAKPADKPAGEKPAGEGDPKEEKP